MNWSMFFIVGGIWTFFIVIPFSVTFVNFSYDIQLIIITFFLCYSGSIFRNKPYLNSYLSYIIIVSLTFSGITSVVYGGLASLYPFCDGAHRNYNMLNKTNYKSMKIIPKKDTTLIVNP